ncbi:hypothetical protein BOX15_Mlig009793g1 [Macrostomum lignano]|uniref:Ig-like domain-containing protein n=1 Tax=Macrostomum lignano TaxID=282301 RepID=A0A267ETR8_9PLAT|nr:hypothetical protein BOX15_Mlig009793g1 [Macrostomum lignano]
MLQVTLSVLLVATLHFSGCSACNLTEKILDDTKGLVHRCLNTTGTNEWHFGAACWLRSLDRDTNDTIELEFKEKYIHPSGRDVAQCRRGRYDTVLVYLACFVAANDSSNENGIIRWPGEVWTGSDGFKYTCTNASSANSRDFEEGSRVILYGCNSSITGELIDPESTELSLNGLISKCTFNGRNLKNPRYLLEAIGCWLENPKKLGRYDQLNFGDEYFISLQSIREKFATCRQRYSGEALVHYMCIENGTTGVVFRSAGSNWTDSDGIQRECLPAKPSELLSARVILRACNHNGSHFNPGSVARMEDGSVWRCAFNRYRSEYGWFEAVGCWPKDPQFQSLINFSGNMDVGDKICLSDGTCIAKCEKRRYREEVALLEMVCFKNVGKGAKYRLPYENWTDDSGFNRTCIPMADQSSKFGVGAETILRGCNTKVGDDNVAPGALYFDKNLLVYECSYNSYRREYNFEELAGCWMHDSSGQRITIANGEAFQLTRNQTVATCRKKRYSRRVEFTVEVCFKDSQASLLNWSSSQIAFPKEKIKIGSTIQECDPAATYSDGVDAKWIVFGCPLETGIVSPGTRKHSEDGIVWECAHNDRQGSGAAYSWVKPVGCWFSDHQNQSIVIRKFSSVYNHSGTAAAICEYRRYSEPNLKMLVCFSQANRRIYIEGDVWTEETTGLTKQCVSTSSGGVTTIDAGCWLQAPSGTNSTISPSSYCHETALSQALQKTAFCDATSTNAEDGTNGVQV